MTAEPVNRQGKRRPVLPYEEARKAAAWLKQAREAAALSPAGLGRMVYASPSWIHAREVGATRMTKAEVEQIAGILGVPVPDLGGAG